MKKLYLGIDVGSISSNLVLIDEDGRALASLYIRTEGNPIAAIQRGMEETERLMPSDAEVWGVGTTGSARYLAGVITGADLTKNEITAHARGAAHFAPDVRTVLEIGGQDSKIIILEDGVVVDFAMSTICAAGTGGFLDAQAFRLGIPVEEFGELALKSKSHTNIAGRCTIFAESDMIHKQQIGHSTEDIVKGLCHALVRNYFSGVAKGKEILPPIVFQGGVSENMGIRKAFEEALGEEIIIPEYNKVMGAFGVALLVKDQSPPRTNFLGFQMSNNDIRCTAFDCRDCPSLCEVIEARMNGKVVARWNDRCGKWTNLKGKL